MIQKSNSRTVLQLQNSMTFNHKIKSYPLSADIVLQNKLYLLSIYNTYILILL